MNKFDRFKYECYSIGKTIQYLYLDSLNNENMKNNLLVLYK